MISSYTFKDKYLLCPNTTVCSQITRILPMQYFNKDHKRFTYPFQRINLPKMGARIPATKENHPKSFYTSSPRKAGNNTESRVLTSFSFLTVGRKYGTKKHDFSYKHNKRKKDPKIAIIRWKKLCCVFQMRKLENKVCLLFPSTIKDSPRTEFHRTTG